MGMCQSKKAEPAQKRVNTRACAWICLICVLSGWRMWLVVVMSGWCWWCWWWLWEHGGVQVVMVVVMLQGEYDNTVALLALELVLVVHDIPVN